MNIHSFITILISFLLCTEISSINQPCYPPNSDFCACSGFETYCQLETGLSVIEFPNSGSFIVQNIDYSTREIRLLDLEGCLAQKMIHLNLSSTPFQYKSQYNQYYTVYECLSMDTIVLNSDVHKIDCLSTLYHTVVAAPWNYTLPCDKSGDGMTVLPVDYQHGIEPPSLVLTWSSDSKCSPRLACPANFGPSSKKNMLITTAMSIGLGILAIMGIAWCLAKIIAMRRSSSISATRTVPTTPDRSLAQSTIVNVDASGLNQSSLDSYPIVVIGESGRFLKSANQDTACSICLSDYCPSDTLKFLPNCLHRFHADCIDEWLRAKALCPICRTTPPRST